MTNWPPSSSEMTGHLPPPPNGDVVPASSGFERLHPAMQRWIWSKGWTQLRDVQERAIVPVLDGRVDVIISAATAGGKTEAAFLPIISRVAEEEEAGIKALCISPLKALINDQHRRLEEMAGAVSLPVYRWHGDVSGSVKRKVIEKPCGILLITPESLEALFVIHGSSLLRVFGTLRYVVVDELHAFIGTERGRQLQSLLSRIEQLVNRWSPRIGLSATLGDMQMAAAFLRLGGQNDAFLITSKAGERELRLQVRGYLKVPPKVGGEPSVEEFESGEDTVPADGVGESSGEMYSVQDELGWKIDDRNSSAEDEPAEDQTEVSFEELAICQHVFKHLRGKDNLVFVNSRHKVESFADRLRALSEDLGVPNEFFPHHGSLAKELREDIEERLKDSSLPTTAVCTSTLEMGIDIGSVQSVAQVGAPFTVAGLKQRLGRSGRRDEPAILRVYVVEEEISPDTAPQDLLREELVQTVAMIRLLLRGWCEPPNPARLHLSTLVQQLLSTIAQFGGLSASRAWHLLCVRGPFAGLTQAQFVAFLRGLGLAQVITQAGDGTLLPGKVGERLVNHYSFYTAFFTPEEFRLTFAGKTLGSLPITSPLTVGAFLIFAGRRWQVVDIDDQQRVIELRPAKGGRVPRFGGGLGQIHPEVRREMRRLYEETELPVFLDTQAQALLKSARINFARLGLLERKCIRHGKGVLYFPWAGDRQMNTLVLMLRHLGLEVNSEGVVIRVARATVGDVEAHLRSLAAEGAPDLLELLSGVKPGTMVLEKYDHYVIPELRRIDYAGACLDLYRMTRVVDHWNLAT